MTQGDQQPQSACTQECPPEPFWQRAFDDPVAVFTLALAVATTGLWLFTGALWLSTRQAVRDAGRTYIAAYRPRLHVRNVILRRPQIDAPIAVQYAIVNIGGTKATITANEVIVQAKPQTMKSADWPVDAKTRGVGKKVAAGDRILIVAEMGEVVYRANWRLEKPGNCEITIRGEITYEDEAGSTRRTGFYRVCSDLAGGFLLPVPPDTDHEYED